MSAVMDLDLLGTVNKAVLSFSDSQVQAQLETSSLRGEGMWAKPPPMLEKEGRTHPRCGP